MAEPYVDASTIDLDQTKDSTKASGTVSAKEQLLREALTCVACKQLVEVCVVLSCDHYMCRRCATSLKRTHELSKLQASMHSEDNQRQEDSVATVVCPECSTKTALDRPLDAFEDVLVSNVAERLRSGLSVNDGQTPCGRCEKRAATKTCNDCGGVPYCDRCASLQHSMGALKRHKLTDIGAETLAAQAPMCANHPSERLSLFCTRCKVPVCAHCLLVGPHLNHPREFIKDAFSKSVDELQPSRDEVARRVGVLDGRLEDLRKTITSVHTQSRLTQSDVSTKIAELHQLLNEREESMLARVHQIEADKKRQLMEQIAVTDEALSSLRQTAVVAEATMKETNPYTWLQNHQHIAGRMESTLRRPMPSDQITSTDFGCDLNVALEAGCLRVLDFQGPTVSGMTCSRPLLAEKRGAIVLSWEPPAQGQWREYVLERKCEDESEFSRVYRGSLPSCELASLTPGMTFLFRVCALGDTCRSEFSEALEHKSRSGLNKTVSLGSPMATMATRSPTTTYRAMTTELSGLQTSVLGDLPAMAPVATRLSPLPTMAKSEGSPESVLTAPTVAHALEPLPVATKYVAQGTPNTKFVAQGTPNTHFVAQGTPNTKFVAQGTPSKGPAIMC